MSLIIFETLTGVIKRLTFHSKETGYTVARFNGEKDLVTDVGSFANIQAGQTLKLEGFWRDHPQNHPRVNLSFFD
jgi:exodeoxyribonuclease V alpha subunit